MTFFIIFGILCVIVYAIAFNSRDKTQDYKINPQVNYRGLVNEDKMRLDMTVELERKIKKSIDENNKSLGINLQGDKDHIQLIIEIYRDSCFYNIVAIAATYNIPARFANSIVNEICDGAYANYVLEL